MGWFCLEYVLGGKFVCLDSVCFLRFWVGLCGFGVEWGQGVWLFRGEEGCDLYLTSQYFCQKESVICQFLERKCSFEISCEKLVINFVFYIFRKISEFKGGGCFVVWRFFLCICVLIVVVFWFCCLVIWCRLTWFGRFFSSGFIVFCFILFLLAVFQVLQFSCVGKVVIFCNWFKEVYLLYRVGICCLFCCRFFRYEFFQGRDAQDFSCFFGGSRGVWFIERMQYTF